MTLARTISRAGLVAVALAVPGAWGCKRGEGGASVTSSPSARAASPASPRSSAFRPATAPRGPLVVPHIHDIIKLDGELSEPPWNAVAARTGPFSDDTGGEARPYSEGRFLWDADNLYVALYASDDDIRASVTAHDGPVWIDDAFALRLTPGAAEQDGGASTPTYAFDISATGVVTDARKIAGAKDDLGWESGIKLGVDRDGTVNNPADYDEEWVIEAAIPLRSMGIEPRPGARVLVEISRCDTPRGSKERRCGAWGTAGARRVLELGP